MIPWLSALVKSHSTPDAPQCILLGRHAWNEFVVEANCPDVKSVEGVPVFLDRDTPKGKARIIKADGYRATYKPEVLPK